jgi:hypothetical protein
VKDSKPGMLGRIWTAYTVELTKALHLKQTYLGPLLMGMVVLLAPWLYPIEHDGRGDYAFIAYITPLALNNLGLLLLLAYCAGLISPELGNKSICQILVRPLLRQEYVLAKFLLGITYAVVLTTIVGLGSWSMVYILGDLTGILYGGELIYTAEEMLWAYAWGALGVLAPLFSAVAYALLISSLTRSPVAAVTGSVGILILVDLLKYSLNIEKVFFSTYLDTPWHVFNQRCDAIDVAWFPEMTYCLVTSFITVVLCVCLAIVISRRRNLV